MRLPTRSMVMVGRAWRIRVINGVVHEIVEFLDEHVLALGRAHDELLVTSEVGRAGDVHGVYGIEKTGEAILRGVGEIVV